MEFRPCIDIHNGKVKQIVGSSLADEGNQAQENFVAEHDAAYFAKLYQEEGIRGGHIILLNPVGSEYYEATKRQAVNALQAYPHGLQIGGGITAQNAKEFLEAGASHVIVTSYVFREGRIDYERLEELVRAVGKKHIVLDVSCKKTDFGYKVVTDRWQKLTQELVDVALFQKLEPFCDEFLIHAVDVEGKRSGIDETLVQELAAFEGNAITYAGGVSSYEDIEKLKKLGNNRIHVTIGSALDLFGGNLEYKKVKQYTC